MSVEGFSGQRALSIMRAWERRAAKVSILSVFYRQLYLHCLLSRLVCVVLYTNSLIVCCIYHAPKAIDESSDESSSDSDSDSESDDDGAARPAKPGRGNGHNHDHDHDHDHGHDHSHNHGKGKARKKSPNAYEKVPKPKNTSSKQLR